MTATRDNTTEAFASRVFDAVLGAIDAWSIFVGDKLGLYRTLASDGPMTESELAARSAMNGRYAREWLEQQVTTGILQVDDPMLPPDQRTYSIPDGHKEVLTDSESLSFLTPFVRLVVAGGLQMPKLLEAYKTGGGVSWAEFGEDMRTGQAEMNRPWFLSELGTSWFPSVPSLHEKLVAGARVADIGCGEGWSSIAMARAYPNSTIEGFDIDVPSIESARKHASAEGLTERLTFHATDAGTLDNKGKYDVVTAFECIHDLSDPISVLKSMHLICSDDGQVVVMDEAVGDHFGDQEDEVERLMYGFSMFVCLPDGMSHQPTVGTGTVFRKSTLDRYASEAGFTQVDVLPIANDLWRFYDLKKS